MHVDSQIIQEYCPKLESNINTIDQILQKYSIPNQPEIVELIEKEYRKPEPSLDEIALLIKSDPGLSSDILQMANSIQHDITGSTEKCFISAVDAVEFLGLSQVETVLQGLSLQDKIKQVSLIRFDRFWDSASDVAIISYNLANKLAFDRLEEIEAYTLGLFRDCGIPIMMQAFQDYPELLRKANASHTQTLVEMENERYGFNHQMVGFCLSQEWHLPWIISWGILTHHDFEPLVEDTSSQQEVKNFLTSTVYIAEIVSNRFRRQMHRRASGEEWPDEWPDIHEYALQHLNISADMLEELMLDILENMDTLLVSYHR